MKNNLNIWAGFSAALILFLLLAWTVNAMACINLDSIDPVHSRLKWDRDVTIIFDAEFGVGQEYAGLPEKLVATLNENINAVKFTSQISSDDMGITPAIKYYRDQGYSVFEAIDLYNQSEQEYRQTNDHVIRVIVDPANTGFSGGLNQFCFAEDECNKLGRVNLSAGKFSQLITEPIAFRTFEYGAGYLQENVLLHELLHACGLPHLFGPTMRFSNAFNTALVNVKFPRSEPLMDLSYSPWVYGLSYNDQAYIQQVYGIVGKKKNKVIVSVTEGNLPGGSLNVALLPVRNTEKALKNKAVARSTYLGYANILAKNGNYRILVRPKPMTGNVQSDFEGETIQQNSLDAPLWICKSGKLCRKRSKAKVYRIRRDTLISVDIGE